MGRSCTRIALVVLALTVALIYTGTAIGAPAADVLRYDGLQVACARCTLGQVIATQLQSAPLTAKTMPAEIAGATTREINLDSPQLEFSAVAAVSPKVTGTGGAVSYRLGANANRTRAVWVDAGVLRWDDDTMVFIGASTNIPISGALGTYGRAGAGIMHDGTAFLYTRAALSF